MTDPAIFPLLFVAVAAAQQPEARREPHPAVPCWQGWTGSTADGVVVYDTRGDIQPYLITHNRDQIRRGGQLEQDYNHIDYWFGDPSHPIRARYYFRHDESVQVDLPADAGNRFSLAEVRERFPADILCYLQRRFDRIEVLVEDGYRELWVRPQ
ncbi:hypothetical protein [Sphingosinicella sp.]|uniref:hypothetical protein n=1 Tax=Sphingosinicella sp. TaxID=1917971 RepID=UPI004037DBDE